jgi:hypothetical protein
MMAGKSNMQKTSVIRSVYFYLASLVTLGITIGSLIFLVNLGLKTWVFTQAESLDFRLGQPPILYLDTTATDASATTKPLALGPTVLDCKDGCTLSEIQKASIEQWVGNYKSWLKIKDNPNSVPLRKAINGFSFLIVALPIFIIHFRLVQKEAKRDNPAGHNPVRPAYFYFVSLAALVMTVVSAGILINVALKTWVFPSAADTANNLFNPMVEDPYSKASVQSVVDCGESCKLPAETITLAKQWIIDYSNWSKAISKGNNTSQQQVAVTIPFILFGVPLFWYHWSVARKESKDRKEEGQLLDEKEKKM